MLAVAIAPPSLRAATVVYGEFTGTDIKVTGLEENTNTAGALFGSPVNAGNLPGTYPPCVTADNCTISGNSLVFSPVGFAAESQLGSPAIETVDGQLVFGINSKPGKVVQNIKFLENGLFDVSGFVGQTTDDTSSRVLVVGNVTVLEVDGGTGITPLVIPITMNYVFTPQSGPAVLTNEWKFATNGENSGRWDADQLIDITQALTTAGRPFTQGASKISVNFDNNLRAKSQPTGSAFIDKKQNIIITVNVPEPASCGLAFLALAGGAVLLRRVRR